MPTLKKELNLIKEGKKVYRLFEEVGPLSGLSVDSEGKVVSKMESQIPSLPSKAMELLQDPQTALIKIIEAGWSKNHNYYDESALKELVELIVKQGPIQFSNHLEEGDKLDRDWNEFVSYSKIVWYDESTKSVYSVVKFPKEKLDTNWILALIGDDPGMVGVSISAAVYVTEDFEKDGVTGDKIDGWAFFDSADYVIWPSAGGKGMIAGGEIKEKIVHAKESFKNKKLSLTVSKKAKVKEEIEKFEYLIEKIKSFNSHYKDLEAYHQIQAVTTALSNFLMGCWYNLADDEYDSAEAIKEIKSAFDESLKTISGLEIWSNPDLLKTEESINKSQKTTERIKMTLAELKEKDPQAYAELQKEAVTLATESIKGGYEKELSVVKEELDVVKKHNDVLIKTVDDFEVKEKKEAHLKAVDEAIREAKLEEKFVTPRFRTLLESQETVDAVKELLEDRKKMLEEVTSTAAVHKESTNPPANDSVDIDALTARVFEEIKY